MSVMVRGCCSNCCLRLQCMPNLLHFPILLKILKKHVSGRSQPAPGLLCRSGLSVCDKSHHMQSLHNTVLQCRQRSRDTPFTFLRAVEGLSSVGRSLTAMSKVARVCASCTCGRSIQHLSGRQCSGPWCAELTGRSGKPAVMQSRLTKHVQRHDQQRNCQSIATQP